MTMIASLADFEQGFLQPFFDGGWAKDPNKTWCLNKKGVP